ncbi:MAG: GNAT family N-acetyltransferase [Paracoccaceae bacterium]
MADLLVRLLDLPSAPRCAEDIIIRRPLAAESGLIADWISANFHRGWADETAPAFARQPIALFTAQRGNDLLGFAAYNVTAPGFFGPTGVAKAARRQGIGAALVWACMDALRHLGHVYAFIGDSADDAFYARILGATPLPGAGISLYAHMLQAKND